MTSPARVAASRANGARSAGPKTAEGKERSRRNATTHGLRSETLIPDEDAGLLPERIDHWTEHLRPTDEAERWLVERIARATIRLDRCASAEEAATAERVRHATADWDLDRGREVQRDAQLLEDQPEVAVRNLQGTAQGCSWLLDRWDSIIEALGADGRLSEGEIQQAVRLLGSHMPLATLGQGPAAPLYHAARPGGSAILVGGIVLAEMGRLEALRAELWERQDGPDRAGAEDRALIDTGAEGVLRLRYEAMAERELFRAWNQLLRERKAVAVAAKARTRTETRPMVVPESIETPAPNEPRPEFAGPVAGWPMDEAEAPAHTAGRRTNPSRSSRGPAGRPNTNAHRPKSVRQRSLDPRPIVPHDEDLLHSGFRTPSSETSHAGIHASPVRLR